MRRTAKGFTGLFLVMLLATPALHAQEPKIDSTTLKRANRPILRTGELVGVLAATGLGVVLDKTVRNRIHDQHDSFGRSVSDVGNLMGSGLEYPVLLGAALATKAVGAKWLYGVSSRAFKSIVLAGAVGTAMKVIVGRERPDSSPTDNLNFHLFSFKDNSFPSGHTVVAFAVATSFAREIKGHWDDALFFTLASVTAYARMHDDRHWLSDVVFGAGVGILSARFIHRREAKLLLGKNVIGASVEF